MPELSQAIRVMSRQTMVMCMKMSAVLLAKSLTAQPIRAIVTAWRSLRMIMVKLNVQPVTMKTGISLGMKSSTAKKACAVSVDPVLWRVIRAVQPLALAAAVIMATLSLRVRDVCYAGLAGGIKPHLTLKAWRLRRQCHH